MNERPPTAEWSLSINDQSSSWAGKLDDGHLTHYNLADANYTEERPKNVQNQHNVPHQI